MTVELRKDRRIVCPVEARAAYALADAVLEEHGGEGAEETDAGDPCVPCVRSEGRHGASLARELDRVTIWLIVIRPTRTRTI